MDFNARIEWDTRISANDLEKVDSLMDALEPWHPAIGASVRGFTEAVVTLPAESIRQAISAANAIAAEACAEAGGNVLAIEVMPTMEFDTRDTLSPMPDLLSVTQASTRLGISPQAVRQRLETGSLIGAKVGSTWVIPTEHLVTA